jgi:opacity protein-like surface antigen
MKSRRTVVPLTRLGVFALAALGFSAPILAQTTGGGNERPFELTPMFGYRFEGTLTPSDAATSVTLKDNATFGLDLGYWIDPNGSLEIQYSYTPTEAVSAASATGPSQTLDVTVQDIQFAGLAHFRVGNPRIRPYLGVGVGVTILDPGAGFSSTSRFSFSLFGGVKTYFSDWFGLRFEARWIPAYLSSGGEDSFWCVWVGGVLSCGASTQGRLLEQADVRAGLIFKF